jgi:HAD superfamily hydrolase (TIGR01549 family)
VPPSSSLRAVLFDWDGTLLDSAEATYRCYNRLFSSFSIPFDRDRFAHTYCPDWRRTYADLGLAREQWAEADARWYALYHEEPAALVAGAREALGRVQALGRLLAVVTSGTRSRVVGEIERHDMTPLFGTVVAAGDTPERKPHPAPLELALRRLEVAPAEAVYVGDSPEDIAMARAAGVFAIAIPGGFPNRAALLASGADAVAPHLAAALSALGIA